jgi:Raf kinase inhibitor-like YbhB/YbcL family protein
MKKLITCLGFAGIFVGYIFFSKTQAGNTMKLMSSTFKEGQTLPKKYSGEGEDSNPPLHWENVPRDTKSLVLLMDDPDAPDTKPASWVHWIVFNIPPTLNKLDENLSVATIKGAKQGLTNSGKNEYHGPMPPKGDGVHRYFFTLYALDKTLDLSEGVSKKEIDSAMKDHILQKATLMGTYERK